MMTSIINVERASVSVRSTRLLGLCIDRTCANSTLLRGGCYVVSLAHHLAQTSPQNGM